MARGHAVAAVIEDASGQQRLGFHPCGRVIVALLVQLGLDGVEQVPINNGGLFAGQDLALEGHLPDVEAVAQQVGERAARERDAADCLAGLEGAGLGDDASLAQVAPSAG